MPADTIIIGILVVIAFVFFQALGTALGLALHQRTSSHFWMAVFIFVGVLVVLGLVLIMGLPDLS